MTNKCPKCSSKEIWDQDCPKCGASGSNDETGENCEECDGSGYHDGYLECSKCGFIDMAHEFEEEDNG